MAAAGPLQRLFVGVPLSEELRWHVRRAQQALPPIGGMRLLPEEQWHVTLAFLGEVEEVVAEEARRVVESVPAVMGGEGFLGGFLMLPTERRARVVALALSDGMSMWCDLHDFITGSLRRAGVRLPEGRGFRPHLTIARLRVPGAVRPKSDIGPQRFTVESVCLYRSELWREGARYTILARTTFLETGIRQSSG